MPQPPLHHLLDTEAGPEQGGHALAAVVRRHRRRRAARLRATALSAVVALGGTALGLGLSQSSTGPPIKIAGPNVPSDHGPANSASAPTFSVGSGAPPGLKFVPGAAFGTAPAVGGVENAGESTTTTTYHAPDYATVCSMVACDSPSEISGEVQVVDRTVDDVHIQALLVTFSVVQRIGVEQPLSSGTSHSAAELPVALPACERRAELVVRVTVAGQVLGQVAVPKTVGVHEPFEALAEGVVRPAGSLPVLVAVAEVSSRVAKVAAHFVTGGFDSSAPSDGWVVLIGRAPNSSEASRDGVTLLATSRNGSALEVAAIPQPGLVGIAVAACPG